MLKLVVHKVSLRLYKVNDLVGIENILRLHRHKSITFKLSYSFFITIADTVSTTEPNKCNPYQISSTEYLPIFTEYKYDLAVLLKVVMTCY